MKITSNPYNFPIDGDLIADKTALLIIDMQRDFCASSGYLSIRGGDMTAVQAIIPRIVDIRSKCRDAGIDVLYTREGHRSNLSDLPRCKQMKTKLLGAEIGSSGPLGRLLIRGEYGWDLVEELKPNETEFVLDKPGTGSFYGTELDHILRNKKIENIIMTGVTTGVCVSSTVREAADHGYNVLVLEDCCAEFDQHTQDISIELLKVEGGYLSTVSDSVTFLSAMSHVEV